MSSEFRQQISLGLNAVLAVMAAALVLHPAQPAPAGAVAMTEAAPVAFQHARQPTLPQYEAGASAADRRRWLIDQLRAMGVPNHLLARVVLADLDAVWNRHGAELALKCHGDPDTMAALQVEIDLGHDAEMRAALGEEGFKQWDHENMQREINQGKIPLTATETEASYGLWKKLEQRELELKRARVKGEMDDAEIGDAHEQAFAEFNQQMKALLGDDRYAKSQQTDAGTAAASFRQELAAANPSEAQFQNLLKAQQQLNETRSALDQQFQDEPNSPDYAAQIKALDDARDQEYQRVLGTNVFDRYQKEQDSSYTRMKKYQDIWGLDGNKVDYVYGALKYYDKSVQNYQAQARALETQGQSVDWDVINKNVQQFSEQTQQSLQNYVGQDNFNKMQRNGIFRFNQ